MKKLFNKNIILFIFSLYIIYFLSIVLPLQSFGIIPRSIQGLIGVITAPFLHGSFNHLFSNTFPLFILLSVLNYFYPKKLLPVVIFIIIVSGLLVWCFARPYNHIGASGLIYGLVAFLITHGFIKKKPIPILVSIIITLMYGGLIWGVFPIVQSYISWESHLFGAIAGILIAFLLKNEKSI